MTKHPPSLQDKIQSTLSATRAAFTKIPYSVSEKAASPQVKTSVGITFDQLAELVQLALNNGPLASNSVPLGTNTSFNSQLKRIKALTDALFNSVRLTAWAATTVNAPAEAAYQLWADAKQGIYVLVTSEAVELVKGLRHYPIAETLEAATLFNAIQQAQSVVVSLRCPEEIPDEEFFAPGADTTGADLDAALADSEAGDVKPEGYGPLAGDEDTEELKEIVADAVEPDEEILEPAKYEAAPIERGTVAVMDVDGKVLGAVSTAGLTDMEDKKDAPESGKGQVAEQWVLSRLKSLQGRILTIVDASPIPDKNQRDAVKTLINKEFRREMNRVNGTPRFILDTDYIL